MSLENSQSPASEQEVYFITAADLPLSCPMPHRRLWDSHPRVYLSIAKTGYMACPYCNAVYQLVEDHSSHAKTNPCSSIA